MLVSSGLSFTMFQTTMDRGTYTPPFEPPLPEADMAAAQCSLFASMS